LTSELFRLILFNSSLEFLCIALLCSIGIYSSSSSRLQSEKALERSLSSSEVLLFASKANLAFLAFLVRLAFFLLRSLSSGFLI
jgi:hypothetical protein